MLLLYVCEQQRLRICSGSPEPLLLADTISTEISSGLIFFHMQPFFLYETLFITLKSRP